MKLHYGLLVALGLAACHIDDGTGSPDPGLYWGWVCDGGGTPVEASAPLAYVASGSCGEGGPFTLSVDGCEMFGSWSVLGLSNVQTTEYASSPGLGGWSVTANASSADGGAEDGGLDGGGVSWNCSAAAAAGGTLTFTCSDATTSATTCQSTLAPLHDP